MNTIKQLKWLLLLLITSMAISCDNQLEMPPYPEYKPLFKDSSSTFNASFDNELGNFTVKSVSGESKWALSKYKYVLMNGKSENANEPNEDWLISPAIQLPMLVTSVLSFDFAAREFASISDEFTIWVSEDYKPEMAEVNGTWNQVQAMEPFKNTADWNLVNSGDISLKLYKGKKVYIAIKYISTINSAGILQIKNITVKDRKPVNIPYFDPFTDNKGKFTIINVAGTESWGFDSYGKYLKMTGRVGSANLINEDWLISPQIDLTKVSTAKLSFDHVARYFKNNTDATVWISENYEEGLPQTAVWTQLPTLPFVDPGSWPKVLPSAGEFSLTPYAGKIVTIAFKYVSNTFNAGTWELKNIRVQEGEAKVINVGKGTEVDPYTIAGGKLYQNTYAWVKGYVVGYAWSASSGTIYTFSADSCTQATNILIADSAHIKDHTKCLSVQLPDGAVRTNLNLVSNKTNIGKLITLYGSLEAYFGAPGLKNTSYYILPDGSTGGVKPVDAIFSESFVPSRQGDFTVNNITLPAGIASIWNTTASYGMLATGFKTPTNNAAEGWLISPNISLVGQSSAKLRFEHAINFVIAGNITTEMTLWISEDNGSNWTKLTIPTYPPGNTWTFISSGEINLAPYLGKTIKIAFKYISTPTKAGSWEVKNFVIYK